MSLRVFHGLPQLFGVGTKGKGEVLSWIQVQFDTGFHERNCCMFLSIMRVLKVVKGRMSCKSHEGTLKNSFYALLGFSF